jgi:hypothetical protein
MSGNSANPVQIENNPTLGSFSVRQVLKSLTAFSSIVLLAATVATSEASAANKTVTRLKVNVQEADNNKCFELSKKSHLTGEHTFLKGHGYQVLQYNRQIRCLKLDPQLPFETDPKPNPNLCLCYGTLSVNTSS